jgi:hypothetical protein
MMMAFKQAGMFPPTSAESQGALSRGMLPNLVACRKICARGLGRRLKTISFMRDVRLKAGLA